MNMEDSGYNSSGSLGLHEVRLSTDFGESAPTYPPDPCDFDETDCHLVWDEESRDWVFCPDDTLDAPGSRLEDCSRLFSPDEWLEEFVGFCECIGGSGEVLTE